jgi:hypothetical protein
MIHSPRPLASGSRPATGALALPDWWVSVCLRRAFQNEVVLIGLRTQWASRRAILARGSQPFPPSVVTTLTQVPSRGSAPFVSTGHRGSPDGLSAGAPPDTLSAGFPPPIVPRLDASRSPLVPLLRYGSSSNSSISKQAHSWSYLCYASVATRLSSASSCLTEEYFRRCKNPTHTR